jgi:hypothetical protein
MRGDHIRFAGGGQLPIGVTLAASRGSLNFFGEARGLTGLL